MPAAFGEILDFQADFQINKTKLMTFDINDLPNLYLLGKEQITDNFQIAYDDAKKYYEEEHKSIVVRAEIGEFGEKYYGEYPELYEDHTVGITSEGWQDILEYVNVRDLTEYDYMIKIKNWKGALDTLLRE